MSFSKKVKEELSNQIANKHCNLAELYAITCICGRIRISVNNDYNLYIHTENIAVAKKYYALVKKTFLINMQVLVRKSDNKKNSVYIAVVKDDADVKRILKGLKLMDTYSNLVNDKIDILDTIIKRPCCKRAFIRGMFLACGAISDPNKMYHFEFVLTSMKSAKELVDIIAKFNVDAKITTRKKYFIVYVKEGAQIVDMLNIMGAHLALMELENIRILKEVRNSVNRNVNCETANINKTVNAATKQIKDIQYIHDNMGISNLSKGLREVAKIRMDNPDMSLAQIGKLLEKPIGKSGVNHRMRKLSQIADELRESNNIKEEALSNTKY